jgi:hypothetical protein
LIELKEILNSRRRKSFGEKAAEKQEDEIKDPVDEENAPENQPIIQVQQPPM